MSGLSSGAVANALAAGRNYQDVARANKQQVIGAVNSAATDLTGAMKERQSRQKVEQYLVSSGMTPEQARSVAMLPAREMGLAISDHLGQKARQQTQEFATSQQDRSFAHDMTMDEALGKRQAADDARRTTEAGAARDRFQSTLGTLTAPTPSATSSGPIMPDTESMDSPEFRANTSFREPDAATMASRVPTIPHGQFDPDAARTAYSRIKEPPANPMEDIAKDVAREQALKAAGVGRYTPDDPKATKPWQPMTREEQLDFQRESERIKREGAGTKPDTSTGSDRWMYGKDYGALLDQKSKIMQEWAGAILPAQRVAIEGQLSKIDQQIEAMKAARQGGPAQGGGQPPGDPAKVKALQDAGKKWDGKRWLNADGSPM